MVLERVEATDHWEPVWSVALQREFPPPATFDHLVLNDKSEEALFRQEAISVGNVSER